MAARAVLVPAAAGAVVVAGAVAMPLPPTMTSPHSRQRLQPQKVIVVILAPQAYRPAAAPPPIAVAKGQVIPNVVEAAAPPAPVAAAAEANPAPRGRGRGRPRGRPRGGRGGAGRQPRDADEANEADGRVAARSMKIRLGEQHYVRSSPSVLPSCAQTQLRALISRELRGHVTQTKAYWNETANKFFNDLPAATRGEFRSADEFVNLVRLRHLFCVPPSCVFTFLIRRSTTK